MLYEKFTFINVVIYTALFFAVYSSYLESYEKIIKAKTSEIIFNWEKIKLDIISVISMVFVVISTVLCITKWAVPGSQLIWCCVVYFICFFIMKRTMIIFSDKIIYRTGSASSKSEYVIFAENVSRIIRVKSHKGKNICVYFSGDDKVMIFAPKIANRGIKSFCKLNNIEFVQ